MLNLPTATEIKKQLPKKAIYEKFNMNTAAKDRFDEDISRITIVNEISPKTTAIAPGDEVSSFYVLQISLKKKDFDERTVASITKLIPQNLLMLLECEGEGKLAIYHSRLIQSAWTPIDELSVTLGGLNLDAVWENIVVQVGGIQIEEGRSLDDQISIDERRAKLQKEIDRLEKLARAERQPKKKFELVQKLQKLKNDII